jgi:hypothetical protein
MADMRKYTSGLLRPEDLNSGKRQEKIINVHISEKFNTPILTFESGDEMLAWQNICRVLARAYGFEDSDWIGHTVELSIGIYTNKDGEQKETLVLTPISSRDKKEEVKQIDKALDDEIPF